ncbi:MAG: TonB-dependent receptor, partial [Duncaniella sp.]|nr:TonB-dependent receptor [Duncaniella sp.]
MKIWIMTLSALLVGVLTLSASTPAAIRGRVVDAGNGEPLPGAMVKASGSFTSTDREGRFTLALKAGADSVTIRCLGYAPQTIAVSADPVTVRLEPAENLLKDVIVEAPDIYAKGDTLVFNVSRYAQAKDNAIIDVIKRLPGIKVEDDGTIKYQGKPINKFYIDGNDLVGGQYSLATENISHKDVKSVEVMEKHQPIKALEGIEFPEEAGLNLTLREDARGRWTGVLQGGAGATPLLLSGSVYAMRIAPKIQNIFTAKGDNTGWNPVGEILEHDMADMYITGSDTPVWPEYISADMFGTPLAEKRTRDNLSWLANGITAWKSGETSMRVTLNASGDRLAYDMGETTDYLSASIPDFVRRQKSRTNNRNISARFNSRTNRRDYYLNDRLAVEASSGRVVSDVGGSVELSERVTRHTLSATNDLMLVKRSDKRVFTLSSRNTFMRRPDRLVTDGETNAVQGVGTDEFRSLTETRFGRLGRFWKFYVSAGLDLDWHRLNHSLAGLGVYDNSGVNEAFISDLYAVPQADYDRAGWRVSFKAPLRWKHYAMGAQHDFVNAAPSLSVRRRIGARSELKGSFGYRLGAPAPYLYMDSPILSDYHNLFIASAPGHYSHEFSGKLGWEYRNPLKALFTNLSVSGVMSHSPVMSDLKFVDNLIISTFAERFSPQRTLNVEAGVSKGFGHSRMVAGCDLTASVTSAASMRDGAVVDYTQRALSAKPYFKGSLWRWLSMSYEARYSLSELRMPEETSLYHSLRQNLSATIYPSDKIFVTIGGEEYLTRFASGDVANLILVDASATWQVSPRIRLTLTADNFLDRRRYEYVTYGTLSRTVTSYTIRPRTVM